MTTTAAQTTGAECPCGIVSILNMDRVVVHVGTLEPCPIENAPRHRPEPVAVRCDECHRPVGARQEARYDALGRRLVAERGRKPDGDAQGTGPHRWRGRMGG